MLEVPNVMLVGDSAHVRPVEGEVVEVRAIVPVKPCREATAIVDVPEAPAKILTDVGLAETAKS